MRVRHDILSISLFIILYNYNPAMSWDVEGDVPKRKTPVTKKRVEEILVIREQLNIRLR